MSIADLLLDLFIIWTAAQLFGELAERLGQPAVLGELLAGVIVGAGGLGWIDPNAEPIRLLAELGILILLFEIGLETNLKELVRVGGASAVVALTGVALPLAAGGAAALALGAEPILALFLGATLTATSVGVTARVLRDLGHLNSPEARVILGAAILDDVLGLVLLTLITGILAGGALSAGVVLRTVIVAVAFLLAAIVLGRLLAPRAARLIERLRRQSALITASMALAFGLALLASRVGSATIIGAFTAGLILAGTHQVHQIEKSLRPVAHLFVPIFFVAVGAEVDLRPFNPIAPGGWELLGGVLALSALAILTKWAAGLAPFWVPFRKSVIGVGMVPRGEVGLIFTQVGLSAGLLTERQFSALVLVVMITTFAGPLLLRRLLPPARAPEAVEPVPDVERLVGGVD